MTVKAIQIKIIHTLKGRAGLGDDDYRALLVRLTGKRSAKALSETEAETVIAHLRRATGDTPASRASGRFAGKLKALWMSAWNLGIVRSSSEKALIAFVQRQTHVDHTRFLTEPEDARPAIEGLKRWIAREGGVVWPVERGDVLGAKRAVVLAQFEKLVGLGVWPPSGSQERPDLIDLVQYGYRRRLGPSTLDDYRDEHWDRLSEKLGIWLRGALKARAAA